MRDVYSFAPSKRAYQTQFKRWGFPSKQNPAHRNNGLVARIKELWETNTSQRDMLKILHEDGFQIKDRELMRVRAKNRWLLRVPNGMKSHGVTQTTSEVPHEKGEAIRALQQGRLEAADEFSEDENHLATSHGKMAFPGVDPEVVVKRKQRYERLQAESVERWAAKKRRRRTRGWAGLPADPPGPPRFPSETTIDESKQFLSLDNKMYRVLRDQFQTICEEAGFIKKTLAGPQKWQGAKDKLIRDIDHLQKVFWIDKSKLDAKALALDVICTDVTKRMRTLERRMTIAEAKNILGVNPEESRQIRNAFYSALKADHFTSKLETGDEHWKELKEKWIQDSSLLQSAVAGLDSDPGHTDKLKAMEVLCRDVRKRLRDDQTKWDPTKQHPPSMHQQGMQDGINSLASEALATSVDPTKHITTSPAAIEVLAHTSDVADMQIDPSLLVAGNLSRSDQSPVRQNGVSSFRQSTAPPVAIYVRPHQHSQIHHTAKMWLGSLSTRSLVELHDLILSRWPDVAVARIDGIEKCPSGEEISYVIEENEELEAYLMHVHDRKATFVVHLRCP